MSATTKLPVLLNFAQRGTHRDEAAVPSTHKSMTPRLPTLSSIGGRGRSAMHARQSAPAVESKSDMSAPLVKSSTSDDASTDCSCLSSYSDSSSESPGFEDTHIVFDWDDTLLPTSAINAGHYSSEDRREFQKTVRSVLVNAAKIGKVIIVTNGNAGWVEESSNRYLAGLSSALEGVEIVSARAQFEHLCPEDPVVWKKEAFKALLRNEWESKPECRGLNLMVVGDSPVEMQAVHSATWDVAGNYYVKTLKLVDFPSPQQLLGELRHLKNKLGDLAKEPRSFSQCLVPRRLSEEDMASGWRLEVGGAWDSDGPLYSL